MSEAELLPVLVPTPAHTGVAGTLGYSWPTAVPPGTLVRVPLGRREVLGIVWDGAPGPLPERVAPRALAAVLDGIAPLGAPWRRLVDFTARYYQRAAGELALAALPPQLRDLDAAQLARRLRRTARSGALPPERLPPDPTEEQAAVLQALRALPAPYPPVLLHGATGSGKTEVYLRAVADALAADPAAQALVLVPEINLTPQLEARFKARFGHLGPQAVVSLHSGMTNPQRLAAWLAAHAGTARVLLGTRMAVLAPLPGLALIVVDEEHDPSYKQQEGARYSARDLAVWRAQDVGCRVLLGSATPSLESWYHSRPPEEGGRYLRLSMPARVGAGTLPRVRRVDMQQQPRGTVFAPPLLAAIVERIARGEQSLVLLNRRGWAPVLACSACGWKSDCPQCSAYRVFHRIDRTLRCHHCGLAERVPRACPACGNLDIHPIGRGTEQLEDQLAALLKDVQRPAGTPATVLRIDADSTRAAGALEAQLGAVHAGDVDVLVGTQMVAKGHDFRRITLVAAVNPDGALFSSDFRAPERLFALLMQASGRAGRDAALADRAEMWLQTQHPTHPLFEALRAHDYPAFAARELAERQAAGMPPFAHQALLRCDARAQEAAQAFLAAAAEAFAPLGGDAVTCYPPIPHPVQRVANVERAQMLLEAAQRGPLQRALAAWQPALHALRPAHKGVLRWAIDVDPLAV